MLNVYYKMVYVKSLQERNKQNRILLCGLVEEKHPLIIYKNPLTFKNKSFVKIRTDFMNKRAEKGT